MSALWTTTAATANYATAFTNPATKYRRARRNTGAVFAHHPGLFVGTELWSPLSRSAVYRVLRNHGTYRHHTAGRNQSVLIAWDAQEWAVEETGAFLLHGKVTYRDGRRTKTISDARWAPWALLRHRKTGRKVYLVGVHMTPPATARGSREAERNAARALATGYENLIAFMVGKTLPTVTAGDWNDDWRGIRGAIVPVLAGIEGRGAEPDYIVTRWGRNVILDLEHYRLVTMPATDHKGAVFADVTAVAR